MKYTTLISLLVSVSAMAVAGDVKVKIDNKAVVFDAMPKKVNGITMVPLKSVLAAMGGTMRWDAGKRQVSAWNNSRRFDFVLNSRDAIVNEKPMRMEETPVIEKNRIYVPLKFIADASGYMISMEKGWYVLRVVQK